MHQHGREGWPAALVLASGAIVLGIMVLRVPESARNDHSWGGMLIVGGVCVVALYALWPWLAGLRDHPTGRAGLSAVGALLAGAGHWAAGVAVGAVGAVWVLDAIIRIVRRPPED